MVQDIERERTQRIRDAKEILCEAEDELAKLLQALETVERADKKMISDVLKAAFEKLAAAKSHLALVLGEPVD